MSEPETSDPKLPPSEAEATQRFAAGEPASPFSTQRLNVSDLAERTLKVPLPDLAAPQEQTQRFERPVLEAPLPVAGEAEQPPAARPQGGFPWKLSAALGLVVLVGGGAAYIYLQRSPTGQAAPLRPSLAEAVPEGVRAYLDQAKAGDTGAMRMLGVMYYYGLNVPQDREKGLYWYRQAADKGSETARAELAKLEAAGK